MGLYAVMTPPFYPTITVVAFQCSATATLHRNATSERRDSSFAGLRCPYGLDFPRLNFCDSLAGLGALGTCPDRGLGTKQPWDLGRYIAVAFPPEFFKRNTAPTNQV